MTQIIIVDICAIAIGLVVFVLVLGGMLWMLRVFIRQIQTGRGPMGSVLQQSRELTAKNLEVAGERLQVEKDLLAAQRETNALLKQIILKLEKQP